MPISQKSERRRSAAEELQQRCPAVDSQQVVDSLSVGLSHLRDLLVVRTHDDVESKYGADSMLGTSLDRIEKRIHRTKVEIEAYACIVVEDEAVASGYIDNDGAWFTDWIFRLRFGEGYASFMDQRLEFYHSPTMEERRLKFLSALQRAMPESTRTPLVLFRLFPRAVRIVAAVAFGDPLRGQELRREQARFLPAITECHECHGRVLDNEEICRCCSNPVWNFAWLLSD